MILGDFNADGSYVSNRDMKKIRIHSDKNFHWLIGDDVDTTASNKNSHTYDRSVPANVVTVDQLPLDDCMIIIMMFRMLLIFI